MKSYPSIDTKFVFDRPLIVFDKLDGSNIRAEWNNKRGFYKFGTRTRLLDETDPMLGGAKQLVLDKYGDVLTLLFKQNKWERAIAFFEYWGERSFAGSHKDGEEHTVTLIDIAPYKVGLLDPSSFLRICYERDVDIPKVLYTGVLTSKLIDQVKDGTLEGMTYEGVVCKYQVRKNAGMFKIKSRAWLADLREMCGDNDALFRRLV